jgi:hypothetical protein
VTTAPGAADEPGGETPGDTNAPDIVGPTGEEMPAVTHDEPGATPGSPDPRRPIRGNRLPRKSTTVPSVRPRDRRDAGTMPAA